MNKVKKSADKRQVKLMLPLGVYQELSVEAKRQGLSLAAYLRTLLLKQRLQVREKNAKIKTELLADDRDIFGRVRSVFD
jgi:hypothetical protein